MRSLVAAYAAQQVEIVQEAQRALVGPHRRRHTSTIAEPHTRSRWRSRT